MRKLVAIFSLSVGIMLYSCGDPSQKPGEDAAREHNENTTGGSGTTGGSENMDEGGMESGKDTTNFQPKQEGGTTPADQQGNP